MPESNSLEEKLQKSSKGLSYQRKLIITLDPEELTVDDLDAVKDIFYQLFIGNKDIELKLITHKTSQMSVKFETDNIDVLMRKIGHHDTTFLKSPTLFIAFFSAAKESNQLDHVDIQKWLNQIRIIATPPYETTFKEEDMLTIVDYLKENGIEEEKLTEFYNAFVYHLILSDQAYILYQKLKGGREEFVTLVSQLDGKPIYFLHRLISKGDVENFLKFLTYMPNQQPIHFVDNKGNTFLHAAKNDPDSLKLASEFTKNINQKNTEGHTALHIAADSEEFNKARYLLTHGADPTIENEKGQNFWGIEPQDNFSALNLPLSLFRQYKLQGNTLKIPPEIINQKGLNCGFYAIACAVNFLRTQHPTFFQSSEPVYARKKDKSPKADISLREKRKELGIPGRGAIFSTKDLSHLVETTGCKTLVCDIGTKEDFLEMIKQAIDLNFPIIIPFSASNATNDNKDSNHGEPANNPKAETAHWATVIGYGPKEEIKGVLLAQYGTYFDTAVDALYKAFNEIGDTFPKAYIHKEKKGKEWQLSSHDNHPGHRVEEIPLTDLTDFRRKLVIVLPPNADPELLKKSSFLLSPKP